jgi:biotin carboxyl carrier protein
METPKRTVTVIIDEEEYTVEVGDLTARPITAIVDGVYYQVEIEDEETSKAPSPPPAVSKSSDQSPPQKSVQAPSQPQLKTNAITAPLPGDVVDILVKTGEKVSTGQAVCVVEAMKMKNTIRSPRDGRVASIEITKGEAVKFGDVLITFE